MSDASIVHIAVGALSRQPPSSGYNGSTLFFHHWSNRDWKRTHCGRLYETSGTENWAAPRRLMVAVRRDTAELIADPCRICFGAER